MNGPQGVDLKELTSMNGTQGVDLKEWTSRSGPQGVDLKERTLVGGRRRGRQRKSWSDNVKEWTSSSGPQVVDLKEWTSMNGPQGAHPGGRKTKRAAEEELVRQRQYNTRSAIGPPVVHQDFSRYHPTVLNGD